MSEDVYPISLMVSRAISLYAIFALVVISPASTTMPVLHSVSQAMRAFGSCRRISSTTASEIRSHILSGCPSETDSEVKKKFLSAIELLSPWKVRGRRPCGDRGTVTGGYEQVQMQSVTAEPLVVSEKRRLRA